MRCPSMDFQALYDAQRSGVDVREFILEQTTTKKAKKNQEKTTTKNKERRPSFFGRLFKSRSTPNTCQLEMTTDGSDVTLRQDSLTSRGPEAVGIKKRSSCSSDNLLKIPDLNHNPSQSDVTGSGAAVKRLSSVATAVAVAFLGEPSKSSTVLMETRNRKLEWFFVAEVVDKTLFVIFLVLLLVTLLSTLVVVPSLSRNSWS